MTYQPVLNKHIRKLRMLCLHGMYQNAEIFAKKTQHLQYAHQEFVEYIYIDGPFQVQPTILSQCQSSKRHRSKRNLLDTTKKTIDFRAWWRPDRTDPTGSTSVYINEDKEILLKYLQNTLNTVGPIDGVLGFSQGASLAAWMCSNQALSELLWRPQIAILIGSYLSPPSYFKNESILHGISSFHLYGENDCVVPAARSKEVLQIFVASTQNKLGNHVQQSVHTQGHIIPKSEDITLEMKLFLQQSQDHLNKIIEQQSSSTYDK